MEFTLLWTKIFGVIVKKEDYSMKFWVDYSASIMIEADNEEEAKETFYQVYCDETRSFAEVNTVEEVEENE